MPDLAVVIPSCDGFEDIWSPALTCLGKFWPQLAWPVYTISETRQFGPHTTEGSLNIQVGLANPGPNGWSANLLNALKQIPQSHVILFVDDMLIEAVDMPRVLEAWEIVKAAEDIVGFRLGPGGETYYHPTRDQRIAILRKDSLYRISCSPTIWRKEYLMQILAKTNSAWSFEIDGTRYATLLHGDVMKWVTQAIAVQYSAITRGRIEVGAKRFMAARGIEYTGSRLECGK